MANTDLRQTTTSDMKAGVPNFSVAAKAIDQPSIAGESFWDSPNWNKYLGYYKQIPELKKSVDALACWTAGKGYVTDDANYVLLENMKGWGEDTFDSIMQNMLIVKKINGDAFAEIIRNDKGTLINLKPLNPSSVRIVVNKKGSIIRYEELGGSSPNRHFSVNDIFHISETRIANEIHGCSVVEACQWVIDAKNEAMADWCRILHRSSVRVIYVDMDNPATLATLKEQWKEGVKNGEVVLVPGQKGKDFEVADYMSPPSQPFMDTIRYYENFFYQAVGIPKIILGGSAEYTEASSKVGYLTFEQVYAAEQRLLEQDLWNQLAIRLTFNRPVSLKEDILTSEAANTGQTGFQPNEMQTQVRRTE